MPGHALVFMQLMIDLSSGSFLEMQLSVPAQLLRTWQHATELFHP